MLIASIISSKNTGNSSYEYTPRTGQSGEFHFAINKSKDRPVSTQWRLFDILNNNKELGGWEFKAKAWGRMRELALEAYNKRQSLPEKPTRTSLPPAAFRLLQNLNDNSTRQDSRLSNIELSIGTLCQEVSSILTHLTEKRA